MPLYDHFHPPLSLRKSWESIHHGWAFVIAQRLNGAILTNRFESESNIHHGSQIEIDLATYEEDRDLPTFGTNGHGGGGVATQPQTYAPPAAALAGEVVMADADTFEINVYKQEGGWKLVAAVELVSPRNKDRSTARRAFATKAASYLQQGVSVVTVDVVTERNANLHEDIANALRLPDAFDWSSPTGLSAVCYRLLRIDGKERLEVWPHQLTVGGALPTVPLWLEPNLAVPLELELTYTSTCESLRIG
ncbi:DUF4058 family protein [Gemmata sp. G18]|uniref:DUF4058 family protein n=1 Tax=Gemmata palustris TaxID=2822762 RepID=A0ABS5C3A5_9BACT|nr:DUF4058 family protein [Gemmata palustris]MBP3959975.1 DUF4058 family protein [Gemmata palustris]